ncbi:unnamed protein product [Oppiella nova]|uniref:Peptidase M13 N-terminal domain-containing protein n=1 Tax=Oppiella nova TaxID=334625 RepID=A0A7R9Q8V6_9ACAR|nr:unnamed protein product [Oppiella nova]CAG2158276.1 unnamed protein product [Oppiella nova]
METTNGRQYLSDGSVITRRPTPRLHCIWWRLRTQLEKTLICGWTAVSLLFLGLIIAIIILLSIQCYICQTKECLNSDESVSPCHDFYRFSCGRWLDSTPIPDDSDSVSTFSQLQDNIDLKLKELLSQPLSASLANGLETEPLMKYIQQLGGWPVLEGSHWNESNFNFSDLMTKLRRFGFKTDLFFKLRVAPNMKRNKEFKIYILLLKIVYP